jgi:hypothetical protein
LNCKRVLVAARLLADGAAAFGAARFHVSFSGDEMRATIPIATAAAPPGRSW